jgi:dihydrofolate reductase
MGKVVYDISMSLDGFISGANARPEEGWAGLGEGGEQLHDWGFNSTDPRNSAIAESMLAPYGAVIAGRTTYDHSLPNWGADGPTGAARLPTIIVSHSVPQDIPAGGVYTFVDSIEAAFATAKKAAGDKDMFVFGGNTAQQLIARGLVDELFIHLAPVLFGSGARLIDDLGGKHVQLEPIEVIQTKEAIHLRFRVVK